MRTLIKNAQTLQGFLDPYTKNPDTNTEVDILLDGQKIAWVGSSEMLTQDYDHEIEASGMTIIPGLFDPQVHFREPGQIEKEDLESGSKAAARGGFSTVVCMPNTAPTLDDPELIVQIIEKSRSLGYAEVLPTGSVTKQLLGEELSPLEALAAAGVVAFTDDGKGIQSDEVAAKAMREIAKLGLPLLDHAEDEALSLGASITLGKASKAEGVKGQDPKSELRHIERGCRLALETGCHYHVLHITTEAGLRKVLEYKEKGAPVSMEVSPHHLLLCEDDIPKREDGLDPNFKMNPPLRTLEDTQALQRAFRQGLIDFVATDHAPHTPDEKNLPLDQAPFGIVGLETAFPLLYTHFVKPGHMSLFTLVNLMWSKPAKLFKRPVHFLSPGQPANFFLTDLEKEYDVEKESFLSKGKNTPFEGWKLAGHSEKTFFQGRIAYER